MADRGWDIDLGTWEEPSWKSQLKEIWETSVDMTKRRYLNLIAEHFPSITHSKVRFIRHGWDNDVLILDERLVFRFPKRSAHFERFKTEVRLLRHMRGKFSVTVPDYAYLPDDLGFGGYHIVPGRPMRRSLFKQLNAATKKNIARELGQFLSVLHAVPVSQARALGVTGEEGGYWESKPHTEINYEAIKTVLFPKLNDDERTWLDTHFSHYLGLNFEFPLKVIHNDVTDHHIYLLPELGKLGGIIDFADVEISDPAMDVAGLWLYGRPFVEDVLGHYDHDIDDDFVERSKMPYRVHSAVNMLQILQGTHTGIPHSFEKLRKQLNREMVLFTD